MTAMRKHVRSHEISAAILNNMIIEKVSVIIVTQKMFKRKISQKWIS